MENWSCIPAILTSFNGKTGNVRPLVKLHFKDGSHADFPEVHKVQVVTPCTAFAGIRLPVRAGDKVILHIADQDIQRLLNKTVTAGLSDPGSAISPTRRKHNITDAIAYTGFADHSSVHFNEDKQFDVWIFNNTDSDSLNHVRLKQNGDIEVKTLKATTTMTKSGDVTTTNDNCTLSILNSGQIKAENQKCSVTLEESGQIISQNDLGKIDLDATGNVTVQSPTTITLDAPVVQCSGNITAFNGTLSFSTHTHSGVQPGPSSTASPNIPS